MLAVGVSVQKRFGLLYGVLLLYHFLELLLVPQAVVWERNNRPCREGNKLGGWLTKDRDMKRGKRDHM
jgi:hypothetical protein